MENARIMLKTATKGSGYAKNLGLCFSFWIMLFEADYAKNYASIMYQCLSWKTSGNWSLKNLTFLLVESVTRVSDAGSHPKLQPESQATPATLSAMG